MGVLLLDPQWYKHPMLGRMFAWLLARLTDATALGSPKHATNSIKCVRVCAAPMENMAQVLRKTVAEAKQLISKVILALF